MSDGAPVVSELVARFLLYTVLFSVLAAGVAIVCAIIYSPS